MLNYFKIIFAYLLTLALVILSTYLITKRNYVPVHIIYNNQIDTIFIKRFIIKKEAKIIKDTIKVDTDLTIDTAVLDTIINQDTLSIKYYFPPINKFELKLSLVEKSKIILDTILVERLTENKKCNFRDKIYYFAIGFAFALLISHI